MQDVRRLIDAELNRIAGAAETEYQRAQSNERTLSAELERLQRQSAVNAQSSVQQRELEREVDAARSVYNAFLVRAREIKEQTSIDSSNARIITAARPPQDPSWPPRLILVAAALAGGLGLGAGLALTREYLAPTVLSSRQLERLSNAPVVAVLPGLRPRGASATAASVTLDHLAATSGSRAAIRWRCSSPRGRIRRGGAPGGDRSCSPRWPSRAATGCCASTPTSGRTAPAPAACSTCCAASRA
ncbi:GNVR domain-containing protein [Methylobacterium oryzae CBMB20]